MNDGRDARGIEDDHAEVSVNEAADESERKPTRMLFPYCGELQEPYCGRPNFAPFQLRAVHDNVYAFGRHSDQ